MIIDFIKGDILTRNWNYAASVGDAKLLGILNANTNPLFKYNTDQYSKEFILRNFKLDHLIDDEKFLSSLKDGAVYYANVLIDMSWVHKFNETLPDTTFVIYLHSIPSGDQLRHLVAELVQLGMPAHIWDSSKCTLEPCSDLASVMLPPTNPEHSRSLWADPHNVHSLTLLLNYKKSPSILKKQIVKL